MFGYVMPPLQNARGRQMQTAGHLPALIAGEKHAVHRHSGSIFSI